MGVLPAISPRRMARGRTPAGDYPDGGLIAVGRPSASNMLTMTEQPTKNSRDDYAAGA